LKQKIFGGVVWNTGGLLLDNGLSMAVKLILARLLLPEEFGIIGFATVFMGMIQAFSDLGMSDALIQRNEKYLKLIDYDTAFWAGLIWGLFLAVVLSLVVSPIAARFFNENLLNTIIPVLSISLILKSLTAVHIVNITRELDFKRIVLPRNISRIAASAIAIVMAVLGFGVWSLVFQRVLSDLFLSIIYLFVSPWRPKMRFNTASFKKIFSFGIYTTGTQFFNYLTGNIDYLLIGKLLGAHQLGIYTLAYNMTYIVRGQIMSVVNKVFYPVYSKIQDNLALVKQDYLKVIKYNCRVIYPLMVGLIFLANPLVLIGLGEKWSESIIPMQIMAGAGLVHLLTSSNTVLLRGLGKPKLEMILSIVKTLGINVPFIVLGTIYYGIIGASVGLLISKIVIFFINSITLKRIAGIGYWEILDNAGSLFAISLITIILFFFISDYIILTVLYSIYLLAHFKVSYQDIKLIVALIKDRKTGETV